MKKNDPKKERLLKLGKIPLAVQLLSLNSTPGIGTEKEVYYTRSLGLEAAEGFLNGKIRLSGDFNEAILRPGDNVVFVFRKIGRVKNWARQGIGLDNLKSLAGKGFELFELYKVNAAGRKQNLKYKKTGKGRYQLLNKNALKPSKINPDPLGLFKLPSHKKKL